MVFEDTEVVTHSIPTFSLFLLVRSFIQNSCASPVSTIMSFIPSVIKFFIKSAPERVDTHPSCPDKPAVYTLRAECFREPLASLFQLYSKYCLHQCKALGRRYVRRPMITWLAITRQVGSGGF